MSSLAPVEYRQSSEGATLVALLGAGLAIVLALVAFGFSVRDRADGGSSGGAAAEKVTDVAVTLVDFKINAASTTFPAGRIRLNVTNTGSVAHNIGVEGIGKTRDIPPGSSDILDLGVLQPGTYNWICDIPGHAEIGMKGTFEVVPSASGGAASAAPVSAPAGEAAAGADPYAGVDEAHRAVVQEFLTGLPAKTEGLGGQLLKPKMENGIPVYDITAKVVQWEVSPGRKIEAWTYNGTVPGPEIRVKQGQRVQVRIKNDLPESTSIHWHGLEFADNKQDGVTYVTQDPITPGQTYIYDLTPINCGSHMYHSHHSADAQVPLGLLGGFIVDCTTTPVPAFAAHDKEYTEILSDGPMGFSINGKGFPATAPIVAKVGEKTLLRFMNEGLIIHPMHLHGHRMTVVAKDGNYLPAPYEVDTINVAPGERYDVIVTSLYPGAWAFHCHILTHAESPQGLHGMTTVWAVQP
jgi:uncharacterized cupredoxin-like copper-binding protein